MGKRYAATVVKMMDYGVFVELSTGSQGLLHISEIALEKVPRPAPPHPAPHLGFRELHFNLQLRVETPASDPDGELLSVRAPRPPLNYVSRALQIRSVDDVLSLGQSLEVAFLGKDAQGRLRLSRKACLTQRSPRD